MHDGRTVREIPRVLMVLMMPGNPGAREVLLIQRYRVVPIHFRVQCCRSLRSRLRRLLCRHLMTLGKVVWITVIARAGLLGFLAGLARGLGHSPLLQSASQLGFTRLVSCWKRGRREMKGGCSHLGLKSSERICFMTCLRGHSSSL